MIGDERLRQISGYLDRVSNDDPEVLVKLREYLNAVYDSEEYQRWLSEDQYAGQRSFDGKPPEPHEASLKYPEYKHLLTEYALIAGGRLQVKIDRHFDRIHITDGFWVSALDRVFPTCDESELVCNYIRSKIDVDSDSLFIDAACGSGHHTLGLKGHFKRRASFDISGRAITFARFNSILNEDARHLVGFGDVRDGICEELIAPVGGHVVFGINMPFAIPPERRKGTQRFSFSQDGGDRGAELTNAALMAVQQFADRDKGYKKLDAVILCYSLGRKGHDGSWFWEIPQWAQDLFPDGKTEFHLCHDQMLWRVNGKKEQPNPMPIESITLKADCVHTFSDSVREAKRSAYVERVKEFKAEGFTHLGYGIVHVSVRR